MKREELLQRLMHNWPAKILSVAAALVLFLLNRMSSLDERFLSVPLTLSTNENMMPASQYPRAVRVTLRGDANSIFLILEGDLQAYVDLSEYTSEGVYKAPVLIRKTGTALDIDPLEIRPDPMEITVALEQKVVREFEIVPNLEGAPETGYELTRLFLSPETVTLEGPRSSIDRLSSISTQSVSLTGRSESFQTRVRLQTLDPLVRIRGADAVELHAVIEESVEVRTYPGVDLIVLGLRPELTLVSPLPDGTVTIQGTLGFFETLRSEQMRLTVDLSHITAPGTYTLEAKPDLLRGAVVLNYEPLSVELTLEAVEPEEPEETDESGEVGRTGAAGETAEADEIGDTEDLREAGATEEFDRERGHESFASVSRPGGMRLFGRPAGTAERTER